MEHEKLIEKHLGINTPYWIKEKVNDAINEASRQPSVSGSLFYQKVEKLVNEWKQRELGETTPYSPEAEIEGGLNIFLRWLKGRDVQ